MKRRTQLALHSAIALAIAGILPSTASFAQDSEAPAENPGHRSRIEYVGTRRGGSDRPKAGREFYESRSRLPRSPRRIFSRVKSPGLRTSLRWRRASISSIRAAVSQVATTLSSDSEDNQAQFSPSFETGALFIDGVYVLNGGTSLSLMDIERVEVIKGPQAAYFGRNTFGGAVNFIREIRAWMSGPANCLCPPLIESAMTFPVSLKDPSFRIPWREASASECMTRRASSLPRMAACWVMKTWALNGKLLWQPTDSLTVKLRAAYTEDDDGPLH